MMTHHKHLKNMRSRARRRTTPRYKIAQALELYVNGMQILEIHRLLKIPIPTISDLLTKCWFYGRIENPVIITLPSAV